jgi:hypothetical protein
MSISRRKFLKAGTLVALSAALPISVFGQNPKDRDGNPIDQQPTQPDPLAYYTRSAFSSYLNSIFQLYTGYSVVEVALVEVKDLMPAGATTANGRECFSLLFRGGSVALPQNTYQVKHPSLGSFQLFLVPGGPDDNGAQSYVAIINRLAYDQLTTPPSRTSKTSDRMKPETPTTIPATAPVTAPSTTTPTNPATPNTSPQKPKPPRKRKPSWKGNDEDFEGGLIDH